MRRHFLRCARNHQTALKPLLQPKKGTALADTIQLRPQTVGAVLWPFQCSAWEAEERLARIATHYRIVDALGAPWRFPPDQKVVLSDLSDKFTDLQLVIDQPQWIMREGGLALNIFIGNFRAFSLAFTFFETSDGRLQAVVGGIQGRKKKGTLELYRNLTKALHGLRPRDFLFEAFKMICRYVGVVEILAVTQAHRYSQHPFFGAKGFLQDYDAIWRDRNGLKLNEEFFLFDVAPQMRDLNTVKPNKRSLYRKRYAFMDALEAQIIRAVPNVAPTYFSDS